ncbi:hypothetical protein EDD85DRAFT_1000826 [Armillaria nabsnona]|nr:hypothetical protein EDD85DRAFT_1000826 [Armillaria nabsnona]
MYIGLWYHKKRLENHPNRKYVPKGLSEDEVVLRSVPVGDLEEQKVFQGNASLRMPEVHRHKDMERYSMRVSDAREEERAVQTSREVQTKRWEVIGSSRQMTSHQWLVPVWRTVGQPVYHEVLMLRRTSQVEATPTVFNLLGEDIAEAPPDKVENMRQYFRHRNLFGELHRLPSSSPDTSPVGKILRVPLQVERDSRPEFCPDFTGIGHRFGTDLVFRTFPVTRDEAMMAQSSREVGHPRVMV